VRQLTGRSVPSFKGLLKAFIKKKAGLFQIRLYQATVLPAHFQARSLYMKALVMLLKEKLNLAYS
jgi:hypothetical protein